MQPFHGHCRVNPLAPALVLVWRALIQGDRAVIDVIDRPYRCRIH